MDKEIEIYVRPSAGSNFLTIYAPSSTRDKLIAFLKNGVFQDPKTITHLELSVLPEWITDANQRAAFERDLGSIHIRIPIAAMNAYFEE